MEQIRQLDRMQAGEVAIQEAGGAAKAQYLDNKQVRQNMNMRSGQVAWGDEMRANFWKKAAAHSGVRYEETI